mmetsp:Transcript_100203/g.178223  ORF Transcript_100203/g.178223 Transcript_100203/m.178223 type:complete len:95 (-) Transcript_100203:30-314(-)
MPETSRGFRRILVLYTLALALSEHTETFDKFTCKDLITDTEVACEDFSATSCQATVETGCECHEPFSVCVTDVGGSSPVDPVGVVRYSCCQPWR